MALRFRALARSGVAAALAVLAIGCGESRLAPEAQQRSADRPGNLYLAGHADALSMDFVRIVDLASGDSRTIEVPGLGGDATYWLVARGDRLVYWAGSKAVYATDLEFEEVGQRLGQASPFLTFIPAAESDRVWLTAYRQGTSSVTEVSADGQVTEPPVRPPDDQLPSAAVHQGLVLPSERGDRVWDPNTGETVLEIPGATVATHGDLLAWCSAPAEAIKITDAASRSERTVSAPDGLTHFECGTSEFSPDGSWLVITIIPLGAETQAGWKFALVDVERDEATMIPGAAVSGEGYVEVAWAPSGDAVYVGEGNGGYLDIEGRVFEYRLGAADATPLEVKADFYRMAAG